MAEGRNNISKKVVLWFIYLALLVPGIASFLQGPQKPLEGAYYHHKDIKFSWPNWFFGEYQKQKEKFLGVNYGFHNYYVRATSEMDYRLFGHPHTRFVVIGKNNYLYESEYIQSYYGRDFLGEDSISRIISKLKCVQDTLKKLNKIVLPVFAAGKAWYYPEYIPDRFKSERGNTNYDIYIKLLKQSGMEYLDFNEVFSSRKSSSPYPLYPQFGIHWSNYGSIMMFDSLLHFVESKIGRDVPELFVDSVQLSDSLRYPDNDVVRSLNLISKLNTFPMGYPHYHVECNLPPEDRLNLLVVSDSFWWYLYSTGLPDHVFNSKFWFYNEEMYPESAKKSTFVKEHNYYRSIREADVILILHTPSTLYKFGNGFVKMLHETYCAPNPVLEELQSMKGIILGDTAWIAQVRLKAWIHQITVDSMLNLDARYVLDQKKSPKPGD